MNKTVTFNGKLLGKITWAISFVVLVYTFLVGANVISPTNDWLGYPATLALGLALMALAVLVRE